MKFFLTICLVLAFATSAFAANVTNKIPFNNISALSGSVKYSDTLNVTGYKTKTLHLTGVTKAGIFKSMSGTTLVECAPTTAGPWSTCVANDYAQTAVSRTTNGSFTWSDVSNYVRVKWTGGTVKTWIKAWLSYMNEN